MFKDISKCLKFMPSFLKVNTAQGSWDLFLQSSVLWLVTILSQVFLSQCLSVLGSGLSTSDLHPRVLKVFAIWYSFSLWIIWEVLRMEMTSQNCYGFNVFFFFYSFWVVLRMKQTFSIGSPLFLHVFLPTIII